MNFPKVKLNFLRTLTDSTGIIQHSAYGIPNRLHGYTTDDNARALIAAIYAYEDEPCSENLKLIYTYLSFMNHAYNPEYAFRNIMNYQRKFQDINGTDDCLGRSLWGCGTAASSNIPEAMRLFAKWLFIKAFTQVEFLTGPRSKAYALLGLYNYLKINPIEDWLIEKGTWMADTINTGLIAHSDEDWVWYEPYLTYGNAIIPMGMIAASEILKSEDYSKSAEKSIDFLTKTLIIDGKLDLIGNDGWYPKGGKRAKFDQQTIDAGYTVILYALAYKHFKLPKYKNLAYLCYEWFFGNNISNVWVYDPETNGCFDAVIEQGVNLNQGAESIICLLMAQNHIQRL